MLFRISLKQRNVPLKTAMREYFSGLAKSSSYCSIFQPSSLTSSQSTSPTEWKMSRFFVPFSLSFVLRAPNMTNLNSNIKTSTTLFMLVWNTKRLLATVYGQFVIKIAPDTKLYNACQFIHKCTVDVHGTALWNQKAQFYAGTEPKYTFPTHKMRTGNHSTDLKICEKTLVKFHHLQNFEEHYKSASWFNGFVLGTSTWALIQKCLVFSHL